MCVMASTKSNVNIARRRSTVSPATKESTSEDQALTTIAKEAEARLAAKRAARAEARSIRMKELESRQKEQNDIDEESDADSVDSLDNRSSKKSSRNPASCNSNTTTTNHDYSRDLDSSKQGHYSNGSLTEYNSYRDTNGAVAGGSSSVASSHLNEREVLRLRESVREWEDKYKKAMVNSAQYDNERQAFQYHSELLKDIIEELQEKIDNTGDELLQKCREYNRLNREHGSTAADLKKCMAILEERERVMNECGLNMDGTLKEGFAPPATPAPCVICSSRTLRDSVDSPGPEGRDRGALLAEINKLKSEMDDIKRKSKSEQARRELESLKRNMHTQVTELKTQIQVLEQKNAQKDGLVVRLETQVKRYKQQADAAESVEDNLLADKRKISRELRQCQEQIMELENEKELLKKRLEKMKSRRGVDV